MASSASTVVSPRFPICWTSPTATDHTRRHIDGLVDALSRNRRLLEAGVLRHSLDFNLERARAWTAQSLQAALGRIPPSTRKTTLPKA
jgi:hypothetical protein